jgi:hypothetical protein
MRLHPESERRWGNMTVVQTLAHCTSGIQMATGVINAQACILSRQRHRPDYQTARDELQDLFDLKASEFSFSTFDHLRWDLKEIFDMAVSEGHRERNPALLLFKPREAKRSERRVKKYRTGADPLFCPRSA